MTRSYITRRTLLAASGAAFASISTSAKASSSKRRFDPTVALRKLEGNQARLGVCFLDTNTSELVGHRLDEHFAFCSTFKLPMVAAVLREADNGRLDLNEVLPYSKSDLLSCAPVTGKHVDNGGLSIALLAQSAQELSDGTAANLLVRRLGGPAAVTAKFREMGDSVTRLDRYEPDLGLVLSGDLRDTTTPRAMAQLVRRIATGSILQPASRQRLLRWMEDTTTGTRRLRAGLPSDWRTGNKTGTGRAEGTTNKCNDVAITFPPIRGGVVIAAYFDSGEYTAQVEARHEAVVAEVGKIAATWAVS
jgi:beta-lactamase class A